jgi:VanZ family protein
MKPFLLRWLPLLLWMAVIFTASADANSVAHTSTLLEPLLRWLMPDISTGAVESVRWFIRKGAHVTEYAVLAWLWWRALRGGRAAQPWSWRTAGLALLFSAFYAATDEFHQLFVSGRSGTVWDVLIDTAGAALGLAAVRAITRWHHARKA